MWIGFIIVTIVVVFILLVFISVIIRNCCNGIYDAFKFTFIESIKGVCSSLKDKMLE